VAALQVVAQRLADENVRVGSGQRVAFEVPVPVAGRRAGQSGQRIPGLEQDRRGVADQLARHERQLLVVVVHEVHELGPEALDDRGQAVAYPVRRLLAQAADRHPGHALARRIDRNAATTLARVRDDELEVLAQRAQIVEVDPLDARDDGKQPRAIARHEPEVHQSR
jgi:hypothetical protein